MARDPMRGDMIAILPKGLDSDPLPPNSERFYLVLSVSHTMTSHTDMVWVDYLDDKGKKVAGWLDMRGRGKKWWFVSRASKSAKDSSKVVE